MLAATYLAGKYPRADKHEGRKGLQCAVFLCGLPFVVLANGEEEARLGKAEVDGGVISIPTASIYGSRDGLFENSKLLAQLCARENRLDYDHGGGHEVPKSNEALRRTVEVIELTIRRATFGI